MATLVAICYPDQYRAAEVMATVRRLQKEYLLDIADACYVTKDRDGKVRLHQAVNLTAEGAIGGAFWGALIGLLFLMPVAGAALGAAGGALGGALSDYGMDDQFIRDLAAKMQNDSSAIFTLVVKATADKVVPQIAQFGGTILKSSLSEAAEAKFQAELNALARPEVVTGTAVPAPSPA